MIIIRIGGSIGLDEICNILDDLKDFKEEYIVLHGANRDMKLTAKEMGMPLKYIKSRTGKLSLYSNQDVVNLFLMVYSGYVNKKIVSRLQGIGVNAVGISGIDGGLIKGIRKEKIRGILDGKEQIVHGDHSGKIEEVNIKLLKTLLKSDFIPVVCSPGVSFNGVPIIVDSDKILFNLSLALKPEKIIMLGDTKGIMEDVNDEGSLITRIKMNDSDDVPFYIKGRAIKKYLFIKKIIKEAKVKNVIVGSGLNKNPVEKVLSGEGTHIS